MEDIKTINELIAVVKDLRTRVETLENGGKE